jgi:hypothetical protein
VHAETGVQAVSGRGLDSQGEVLDILCAALRLSAQIRGASRSAKSRLNFARTHPSYRLLLDDLETFTHGLEHYLGLGSVCRMCGCSEHNACEGGCSWVEHDLCSACVEPAK